MSVGVTLKQEQHGRWLPEAYYSKKLNTAERKYPVHDRELLAIVNACSKWRCYLANRTTKVFTDHKPLEHFNQQPKLNSRQIRWLESLADYRLEMVYRPGKQNTVPDILSRPPLSRPPSPLAVQPAAPIASEDVPARPAMATAALSSLVLEPGWLSSVWEA